MNTAINASLGIEAENVRRANHQWVKAERARNLDAIMPHIAEGCVFQLEGLPTVRGASAVRDFYQGFFAQPFTDFDATPDDIVVSESGDLAMDIGHSHFIFETEEGGDLHKDGKYLAVWQKSGDEWKCIAISFTWNERDL